MKIKKEAVPTLSKLGQRKEVIVSILVFLLIIALLFFLKLNTKEEKITGAVTTQAVAINITVTVYPPTLAILSPENKTYLKNTFLLLNFTSNGLNFWYNIDGGSNTTATSPAYFNTTQGSHTLFLYANNSAGVNSSNVSFIVNSSRFIIIYSEYNGTTKGSSTEFINFTYEDIHNLSGIILENMGYGKIAFNRAINLTNDSNSNDNSLDLNSNTDISFNRIELNGTALPNFNVPATLTLYDLTFTNPRILKDGSVCSSSICTQNNYSGGNLSFNVTGFSVYSAEETPSSTPPTTGGVTQESGGGSRKITTENFTINPEEIKITLKQGETKEAKISIKNTGAKKTKITISNTNLENFIRINNAEFDLEVGQTVDVIVDFIARENAIPDLYLGKLIISGDGLSKEILVAIEVETKKPLFDVKVNIPRQFRTLIPGDSLVANIELFNLGDIGKVDVVLDYFIKDINGNDIITEKETVAVETRASLIKEFLLPEDLPYGNYIVYVKATYDGETASSTAWFVVAEKKPFIYTNTAIFYGVAILILILLIILYLEIKKFKKENIPYINERTLLKRGMMKKRKEK